MPSVKIEKEKCKGCLLCINVCPKNQLKEDKNLNNRGVRPVVFLGNDCTGCANCAVICPETAIEVYR